MGLCSMGYVFVFFAFAKQHDEEAYAKRSRSAKNKIVFIFRELDYGFS